MGAGEGGGREIHSFCSPPLTVSAHPRGGGAGQGQAELCLGALGPALGWRRGFQSQECLKEKYVKCACWLWTEGCALPGNHVSGKERFGTMADSSAPSLAQNRDFVQGSEALRGAWAPSQAQGASPLVREPVTVLFSAVIGLGWNTRYSPGQ